MNASAVSVKRGGGVPAVCASCTKLSCSLLSLSHMVLISRPVAVVAGWQSYSSYAFVLGWVLWEKYVSLIHSLDETFCVTSYHEFDRTHEEEGG